MRVGSVVNGVAGNFVPATPRNAGSRTLSWSVTGLTENTDYQAQASLSSDYSDPETVDFRTPGGPEVTPPRITAINSSSGSNGFLATVIVANPDSSAYVYARYKARAAQNWIQLARNTQDVRGASFDVSGLQPITQYDFQASLRSDYGDPFSIIITTSAGPAPPPPDTPTGGTSHWTVEAETITQTTIGLHIQLRFQYFFNDAQWPHRYYVQWRRAGTADQFSSPFELGVAISVRHTITGLTEGTQYQIRVYDTLASAPTQPEREVTITVSTEANTTPAIEALSSPSQQVDGVTMRARIFNAPPAIYWRYRRDAVGSPWSPGERQSTIAFPLVPGVNRRKDIDYTVAPLDEDSAYQIQLGLTSSFGNSRTLAVRTDFRRPTVTGWNYEVNADHSITFTLDIADARPGWRALALFAVPDDQTGPDPTDTWWVGQTTYDYLDVTSADFGEHDVATVALKTAVVQPAHRGQEVRLLLTTQAADAPNIGRSNRQQGIEVNPFVLPGFGWPQLTGIAVDSITTSGARVALTFDRPAVPTPNGALANVTLTDADGQVDARSSRLAELGIPAVWRSRITGLDLGTRYTVRGELYGYFLETQFSTLGSTYGVLTVLNLTPTSFDLAINADPPDGRLYFVWYRAIPGPDPEQTGEPYIPIDRLPAIGVQPLGEASRITRAVTVVGVDRLEPETAYQCAVYTSPDYDFFTRIDAIDVITPALPPLSLGSPITFDQWDGYEETVRACIPVVNPRDNVIWRHRLQGADWADSLPTVIAAEELTYYTLSGVQFGQSYDVQAALEPQFLNPVEEVFNAPTRLDPTAPPAVAYAAIPRINVGDGLEHPDRINTWIERINYLQRRAGNPPSPDLTGLGRDDGAGRIVLPLQDFAGGEALRRYVRTADRNNEQALILANYQGGLAVITADGRVDISSVMALAVLDSVAANALLLAPGNWLNPPTQRAALYYNGAALEWIDIAPLGVSYSYFVNSRTDRADGSVMFITHADDADYDMPAVVWTQQQPFPLSGTVNLRLRELPVQIGSTLKLEHGAGSNQPQGTAVTGGANIGDANEVNGRQNNWIANVTAGDRWQLSHEDTGETLTDVNLRVWARIRVNTTSIGS